MEQLDYNLLFRWFVGLSMDDKVWDHSVFSKNQERFLDSDLAAAFFAPSWSRRRPPDCCRTSISPWTAL
jgi:hypothetical protein